MITVLTDISARSQTFRSVLLSVCKISLIELPICFLNVHSSDQDIWLLVIFIFFSKPAVLCVNSIVLFLKSSLGCLKWWEHPWTAVCKMHQLEFAALCLPALASYATDIVFVDIILTLVFFLACFIQEKRWLCSATSLMLLLQRIRWARACRT